MCSCAYHRLSRKRHKNVDYIRHILKHTRHAVPMKEKLSEVSLVQYERSHKLATALAAFWVRIQTSLKIYNGRRKQRSGQRTLALKKIYTKNQCSGSMTFWCGSGSGSADPCLWLVDRIRIRILLFSSLTFKKPTKN